MDEEECIGCGACVDSAPDVFSLNEDNIAEIINAAGGSAEEIQDAMDACPSECIHWEDED